ncbi:hypothetical protein SOVF_005870 [Spinacia oleracea]|nr:hypothetical protein SOVF_005870 [Spinacia oleracea]
MQNKAQYIKPDSMRLIFSNKESDPYLAFELFGRPGLNQLVRFLLSLRP